MIGVILSEFLLTLIYKRSIISAKGFLVFASLFFYSWWYIVYLPLILSSILFNYLIGTTLSKSNENNKIGFSKKSIYLINCIFLNESIHYDVINNSIDFIEHKNDVIDNQFSYIKFFPDIFPFKNNEMRYSIDNIDTEFKNKSTIDFYKLIKNYLIY